MIILASIVEEETANTKEKPMVAGMYYKRLTMRTAQYPNGMPLQADPTIKFAWKKFELKRIYNNHLAIESPYNTYRNTGLPPGPIRIPSIEGIDAVLNLVHHNYIYMCAKEDFSGTHNFAETYEEHLQNAAKYTNALNKRGINKEIYSTTHHFQHNNMSRTEIELIDISNRIQDVRYLKKG